MSTIDTKDQGEAQLFNRDEIFSQLDSLFGIEGSDERLQQINEFVKQRLKLLVERSSKRDFLVSSQPRRGFLHPESGISRNLIVDPFHVDDSSIYTDLVTTFRDFNNLPDWQGKSLREIAPHAIQRTIGIYFGNEYPASETQGQNIRFYLERSGVGEEPIHLNELKGKRIAVCAEKAALAQNLLSFLGYDSQLVVSNSCKVASENNQDSHMFNIVTSDNKHLIYDPTNPVYIWQDDGKLNSVGPAFYSLSADDYQRVLEGGRAEVTHHNYRMQGKQLLPDEGEKRVYGGQAS